MYWSEGGSWEEKREGGLCTVDFILFCRKLGENLRQKANLKTYLLQLNRLFGIWLRKNDLKF